MASAVIDRVSPQIINLFLFAFVLLLTAYLLESRQRLARLEKVSMFDPLTGLLGAPYFHSHIWPARVRSSEPLAVIWIDLDGLKPVNDLQGHDAGDTMIRHAADTLQRAVRRGNDVTVRLHSAGDEFLVLGSVPSSRDASQWAHNLHNAITSAGVPCSIGMAWTESPQHRDRAGLLKAAEGLCQAAKRTGRGRVVVGQIDRKGSSGARDNVPVEVSDVECTVRYSAAGFPSSMGQEG